MAQKVGLGEAKPLVCESSIPKPKPPAPMPASTQVLSTSQPNSQGSLKLPEMSSKSVGALDPHTGVNKANLGTSPSDILAADIDASLSPSMRGVTGFSGGWSATASPSQTSGQKGNTKGRNGSTASPKRSHLVIRVNFGVMWSMY